MKNTLYFLFLPMLLNAQIITEYPNYSASSNTNLEIIKVTNHILNTSIKFKFTHRKKTNSGVITNILGLNPDQTNICIHSNSFLFDTFTKKKYELTRIKDIPYCITGRIPVANHQSVEFELFFDRLPPGVEIFDFKESVFLDTTLINRKMWAIQGIEAANPEEGKLSTIKSRSKNQIEQPIKQLNVFHFEETKATLSPESENQFYHFLNSNRESIMAANLIKIIGHTDKIGDYEKNLRLSIERATHIKNLMEKEGIDPNKIITKGYSHLKVLSLKRDHVSKLKNRRVEVLFE
jgi:outer membrane protein OmpA-like peptidoglycan-associated protein